MGLWEGSEHHETPSTSRWLSRNAQQIFPTLLTLESLRWKEGWINSHFPMKKWALNVLPINVGRK